MFMEFCWQLLVAMSSTFPSSRKQRLNVNQERKATQGKEGWGAIGGRGGDGQRYADKRINEHPKYVFWSRKISEKKLNPMLWQTFLWAGMHVAVARQHVRVLRLSQCLPTLTKAFVIA